MLMKSVTVVVGMQNKIDRQTERGEGGGW